MDITAANNIGSQVVRPLNNVAERIANFIPNFIGGFIILLIGWIISSSVATLIKKALELLNIGKWFGVAGLKQDTHKNVFMGLLSQIVFWWLFILFLIPAFQAWQLTSIVEFLNKLLAYIPNVIAATVIGFLALVIAKLAGEFIKDAAKPTLGAAAGILSAVTKYSIIIFGALVALYQLGIAPALIDILFSALMFGFALALGLAFGLGGRIPAERVLMGLLNRKSEKQ